MPEISESPLPLDHYTKFPQDQLITDANLGIALPFMYHSNKGGIADVSVKTFTDEKGNLLSTRISGPRLGAIEQDVLMVWCSMAKEQENEGLVENKPGKLRVYYTLAMICQRLRKSSNSRTMVKKAINNLLNYKVEVKNFAYIRVQSEMDYKNETMSLISKHGEVKRTFDENGKVKSNASFFVDFDTAIIDNLTMGMVSSVNEEQYFNLTTGIDRRVLVFINSKKKIFGNRFIFSVKELSLVLGLEKKPPRKQRERIAKSLISIHEVSKDFTYEIVKKMDSDDWDVVVEHQENLLIEHQEVDEFFEAILQVYGKISLDTIDVTHKDIKLVVEEFNNKWMLKKSVDNPLYTFDSQKIEIGKFLVDLALHQVIKTGYKLTSFRGLVGSIFDNLMNGELQIPDRYRNYVVKQARIEERERKLVIMDEEKTKLEEFRKNEEKKQRASFELAYEDMILKEKNLRKAIEEQAKENLKMDEGCDLYDNLLSLEMKEVAFEMFKSGKVLDVVKVN